MPVLVDDVRGLDIVSAMPDRYEVVDGEILKLREMSFYSSEVANIIRDRLNEYTVRTGIGRNRNDMLFHVPLPEDDSRNRRPDAALISYQRWPKDRPMAFFQNAGDVVPDLAVEVASPSDPGDDLLAKAEEYLRAGVRTVWIVFPQTKVAFIYEADTVPRAVRASGELDGGAAFPDLKIAMNDLFPPIAVV